jgi:uncharacterized protein with GYD domain
MSIPAGTGRPADPREVSRCPQKRIGFENDPRGDSFYNGSHYRAVAAHPRREEDPMATFIVLSSFTEQGIRNVKETINRAEAFKEMAKKRGATVKDMYWTLGSRDTVVVFEAPDDETAAALVMSVSSVGNVRSETLRAFSVDEMKKTLGKMV